MIEGVGPVTGIDAVALSTAAGLASRQGTQRRQRRLRWLAALREASGEGRLPIDDKEADERRLAETRERIAVALGTIEQVRGLADQASAAATSGVAGPSITAAELARRLGDGGERSLRTQARLGADAVLLLVGASRGSAVNGL